MSSAGFRRPCRDPASSAPVKNVISGSPYLNSDKMTRNPDDLMNLPPTELKSLNDGEFRIYCGMSFEALKKSDAKMSKCISKLDKRLWHFLVAFLVAIFSILATVFLSAAH